jgi:DNA polymerase III epsilon subunit-like protein
VILDRFISVDVEASGPVPGEFSMLSLGACVVGRTEEQFYVELKPITPNQDAGAMRVNGLNHDDLEQRGTDPIQAMLDFESWIHRAAPGGYRPIFVAYPATFDWMFVAYYFHRFLARNPFGVTGLDLTSIYAGKVIAALPAPALPALSERPRVEGWTVGALEQRLADDLPLTHNALEDAIAQSGLFEQLLRRREDTRL